MKKTTTLLEYKVGMNAIIANFVCMWKSRPKLNTTHFTTACAFHGLLSHHHLQENIRQSKVLM